jgi:DNA gyrase/topoisomerase IV subunit B
MSNIKSINGIEHIQLHPNLYLGGENKKTVLCYDGNDIMIQQIITDKNYKIITEILHNAFDHVSKHDNGIVSVRIDNDKIIIKNTTTMKVIDNHIINGDSKLVKTLDVILDKCLVHLTMMIKLEIQLVCMV